MSHRAAGWDNPRCDEAFCVKRQLKDFYFIVRWGGAAGSGARFASGLTAREVESWAGALFALGGKKAAAGVRLGPFLKAKARPSLGAVRSR